MDQLNKINYLKELSNFLKERNFVDPKINLISNQFKNGYLLGKPSEIKVNFYF